MYKVVIKCGWQEDLFRVENFSDASTLAQLAIDSYVKPESVTEYDVEVIISKEDTHDAEAV